MGMPKRFGLEERNARARYDTQPQLRLTALLLVTAVLGCRGDGLNRPDLPDDGDLYWTLDLNHRAVTMSRNAPYDTLTLRAVPRNVHGEELTGLPLPQYVSRNPERVVVTPDGVVRAIGLQSGQIAVVATLTAGDLTHVDSVLIRVVSTAPRILGSFSIHPLSPDSAKVAAHVYIGYDVFLNAKTVLARAFDAGGLEILNPLISFRSSDPRIASVHETTGKIFGVMPGAVTFDASTTIFGVRMVDTLPYQVGWPVLNVNLGGEWQNNIIIGAGGVVVWGNPSASNSLQVTFADPAIAGAVNPFPTFLSSLFGQGYCESSYMHCDSVGNFVLEPVNPDSDEFGMAFALRRFSVPGVYEYHGEFLGAPSLPGFTKRITVLDER